MGWCVHPKLRTTEVDTDSVKYPTEREEKSGNVGSSWEDLLYCYVAVRSLSIEELVCREVHACVMPCLLLRVQLLLCYKS
jgi:hypothetical protein